MLGCLSLSILDFVCCLHHFQKQEIEKHPSSKTHWGAQFVWILHMLGRHVAYHWTCEDDVLYWNQLFISMDNTVDHSLIHYGTSNKRYCWVASSALWCLLDGKSILKWIFLFRLVFDIQKPLLPKRQTIELVLLWNYILCYPFQNTDYWSDHGPR